MDRYSVDTWSWPGDALSRSMWNTEARTCTDTVLINVILAGVSFIMGHMGYRSKGIVQILCWYMYLIVAGRYSVTGSCEIPKRRICTGKVIGYIHIYRNDNLKACLEGKTKRTKVGRHVLNLIPQPQTSCRRVLVYQTVIRLGLHIV